MVLQLRGQCVAQLTRGSASLACITVRTSFLAYLLRLSGVLSMQAMCVADLTTVQQVCLAPQLAQALLYST